QPKNGSRQLLVPGAYQFVSYDLKSGEKLWWVNGMAWQLKSVALIDGDTIYVNGWETGGDFDTAPKVLTWQELVEKYDKHKDGKITTAEAPQDLQRWYRENDLNGDGAIDARDWAFWRLHRTAQNAVSAIRVTGKGDLTSKVIWRYRKSLPNIPSPLLYKSTLF